MGEMWDKLHGATAGEPLPVARCPPPAARRTDNTRPHQWLFYAQMDAVTKYLNCRCEEKLFRFAALFQCSIQIVIAHFHALYIILK